MVGPLRFCMLAAANYRIELHLRPMLHQAHFGAKGGLRTFAASAKTQIGPQKADIHASIQPQPTGLNSTKKNGNPTRRY
jgi:hypothetical protein